MNLQDKKILAERMGWRYFKEEDVFLKPLEPFIIGQARPESRINTVNANDFKGIVKEIVNTIKVPV